MQDRFAFLDLIEKDELVKTKIIAFMMTLPKFSEMSESQIWDRWKAGYLKGIPGADRILALAIEPEPWEERDL